MAGVAIAQQFGRPHTPVRSSTKAVSFSALAVELAYLGRMIVNWSGTLF